jgi:hypothetical protein
MDESSYGNEVVLKTAERQFEKAVMSVLVILGAHPYRWQ